MALNNICEHVNKKSSYGSKCFSEKALERKAPEGFSPLWVDWPNALSREAQQGAEGTNFLPTELKLQVSPTQEKQSEGQRLSLVSLVKFSPRPVLGNSPNLSSSACISISGCPFSSLHACFLGD